MPIEIRREDQIDSATQRFLQLPSNQRTKPLAEKILGAVFTFPLSHQLTDEQFARWASFFDAIAPYSEGERRHPNGGMGSVTSVFRRKYLHAEAAVFAHRPAGEPQGAQQSPWFQHASEVDRAWKGWIERQKSSGLQRGRADPPALRSLLPVEVPAGLQDVDSSARTVVPGAPSDLFVTREYFLEHGDPDAKVAGVAASFVPLEVVKTVGTLDDASVGFTYLAAAERGDQATPPTRITNMEALFRCFMTRIARIKMGADVLYQGEIRPLGGGQCRSVLLSDQVHPDFEISFSGGNAQGIFYDLAALSPHEVIGESIPPDFKWPTEEEKAHMTPEQISEYNQRLLRHLVYHLFPNGVRPSENAIDPAEVHILSYSAPLLEELLVDVSQGNQTPDSLKNFYVETASGRVISLYVLFMVYLHQVRNEFAILEATGRPYVYTLYPPSIFAIGSPGGAGVMNRLQCLAFQYLGEAQFAHLAAFVPNTFRDESLDTLYAQNVFKQKPVVPLRTFWAAGGSTWDCVPEGTALVVRSNADPFGFNLLSEGAVVDGFVNADSLEAAIGAVSSAAVALDPTDPDQINAMNLLQN